MPVSNIYITASEVNDFLDAALSGNTTEISIMLNRRWYMVDAPSENSDTALMLAAWNGNLNTVNMLCQHNASTFATNEDDENVFDQVSEGENKEDKKQMDTILQGARNDEIDDLNLTVSNFTKVVYEKDRDVGVWCTFESAGSIRLSPTPMEAPEAAMICA